MSDFFAIDENEQERLNNLIFSGQWSGAEQNTDMWSVALNDHIDSVMTSAGYEKIQETEDRARRPVLALWQRQDGARAMAFYGKNDAGWIAIGIDNQIGIIEDAELELASA